MDVSSMSPRRFAHLLLTAAAVSISGLARAETAPPRGSSVVGAESAVRREISAVTVLMLAKNEAEKEPNEARRRDHLISVARHIRERGEEAAFGSFVVDMIGAKQEQQGTLDWYSARVRRAKPAFLAGDIEAAKQHLGDCSYHANSAKKCPTDDGFWIFELQRWTLDAGRLNEAVQRLKSGLSLSGDRLVLARLGPSGALLAAGRRAEALELLRELKSDSSIDPRSLAEALWAVGEADEARSMLRQAAAAALAAAAKDVSQPLPTEHARVQLHMGDRDGALVTLRGITRLEMPIEEDPGRESSTDLKYGSLTPASERWVKARQPLARLLARAGLDGEAWKLVDAPLADQPRYLLNLAQGQAERGDFDAALETIDKLRAAALLEPADYRDRRRGSAPMKAAEHARRERAFAINSLMRIAARKPDVPAFRRVTTLYRALHGLEILPESLKWLAEAGRPDEAIALALGAASIGHRIWALSGVAEGIALRTKFSADPFQRWYVIHERPPGSAQPAPNRR
jgi:tetratricopeptide (TPR) repeat protein